MNAKAGPDASLSAKKARFVEEYLVDLNATQAAIRAGYSKKTAYSQGQRLLKNVEIQRAITEARAARSERTNITQDRVLNELAKIGFSDIRRVLTKGGAIMDPQEWDDETAGAIASMEVVTTHRGDEDENGNKVPEHVNKFRTWDKLAALEKIGKHLGMFQGGGSGDEDAPVLTFDIKVSQPVKDVRVTRTK